MILVINAGSSTIKYQLFQGKKVLLKDKVERIGIKGGPKNHEEATKVMIEKIIKNKIIKELKEIKAVGHRVVHGGELEKSCEINKKVIKIIEKYSEMAPLHNPAELKAIKAIKKYLPKAKNIAVFDTAFHQTMSEKTKIYPLPYEYYKKGYKRYGFHGTSHKYIAIKTSKILKKPLKKINLITCHLGSGCSITAIKKGKVIDTSMGYTPLEGVIMNTRTGNIDPGIIINMLKKNNKEELNEILNKKSGLKGICKFSDYRDVIKGYEKKEKKCVLAWDMFCYSVKKYIGAYAGELEKVDAIVFTAGGGENIPKMREDCLPKKLLGIKIDKRKNKMISVTKAKKNKKYKTEGIITTKESKTKVLAIGTDEEMMIMQETKKIIS